MTFHVIHNITAKQQFVCILYFNDLRNILHKSETSTLQHFDHLLLAYSHTFVGD